MTVRYLSVTPDTRKAGGDSAQPSIAERGLSALKWNYLGTGVRVVLQFIIGIVLARILGPEPFGLVGIAWFVIGYGYLVSEMGFSTALVQRRSIDDQDVRYVFTWVCVSAAVMTVLFVAAAPFIAAFFKRPDATVIIQVLSLYFVLQVIGQVPQSLLRRRMDYRSLQRAQVVSYTVAYLLLGIPLAMAGWGVWSLVVAALAQAVTGGLLMYTRAPHSLKPTLRSSNAGYVNFGAKVMATNVASHIMGSVDGIVVGRAFGALDLGLYNRTITLLFNSMLAVVSTLSSVLLSAYSRGQDNLPAARRAYLASLSVVGWLCAPPLLAAAAVPDTVIVALFGAEWAGAARLLTPLSIACLSAALTLVGGPLITGLGRPGTDMRVHMSAAALMIPLVIAASTVFARSRSVVGRRSLCHSAAAYAGSGDAIDGGGLVGRIEGACRFLARFGSDWIDRLRNGSHGRIPHSRGSLAPRTRRAGCRDHHGGRHLGMQAHPADVRSWLVGGSNRESTSTWTRAPAGSL